jgi:hypothetical protein
MQQEFRDATVTIETAREDAVLHGVSGSFTPGTETSRDGPDSTQLTTRFGELCLAADDIPGYFSAQMIAVEDPATGNTTRYEVSWKFKRPYVEDGCTIFQAMPRA